MNTSPTHALAARVRALASAGVADLQRLYAETFDRPTRSRNAPWLRAQIADRWMAAADTDAQGQRLLARARVAATAPPRERVPPPRDPRLPPVGTVLRKTHRGEEVEIKVMRDGFRCRGKVYASASALARAVTQQRWNGLLWLGLAARKRGRRAS